MKKSSNTFASTIKSNELVESLKNFSKEVIEFLEIQAKAFLEIKRQDDFTKITNLKKQLENN